MCLGQSRLILFGNAIVTNLSRSRGFQIRVRGSSQHTPRTPHNQRRLSPQLSRPLIMHTPYHMQYYIVLQAARSFRRGVKRIAEKLLQPAATARRVVNEFLKRCLKYKLAHKPFHIITSPRWRLSPPSSEEMVHTCAARRISALTLHVLVMPELRTRRLLPSPPSPYELLPPQSPRAKVVDRHSQTCCWELALGGDELHHSPHRHHTSRA